MEDYIIAERYADALSQVVHRDRWDTAIDQLNAVTAILTNRAETMHFFASPVIPYNAKVVLLEKILSGGEFLHAVASFFTVILQKGRLLLLPLMVEALQTIINEERNMARARIRVSRTFDRDVRQKIIDKVSAVSGKHLECRFEHDASLIAGFIVEVGTVIYDCSVKNKLDRLRVALHKSR